MAEEPTPRQVEELVKRAEHGEVPYAGIVITRLDDDPIALRASIGGMPEIGFYCRYRGDPAKVAEMLRKTLKALEKTL